MTRAGSILVLNAGSSSLKFELFGVAGDTVDALLVGQADGIGVHPRFKATDRDGRVLTEKTWDDAVTMTHAALLAHLLAWLDTRDDTPPLIAAGHRVVHGGDRFTQPVLVDGETLDALDALTPLAPLHQPHNLAAIRALRQVNPALPQVACFDTAFHATNPPVARRFALPRRLEDAGVRRYGFHGLSYEYVAGRLAEIDPELGRGRVVIAHLGNGASLCGCVGGRGVASTMGFTALDGLPMGTRTGSLDPGVVLYLMQHEGMSADAIERLLYRESGLLGVSGVSSDMRDLRASDDPRAADAVGLFVYRIGREIGSLAAACGGLDALVFTAGIGEHDAALRAAVCDGAAWLGVRLDGAANAAAEARISTPDSPVSVFVIPTDEERMIALHSLEVLSAEAAP